MSVIFAFRTWAIWIRNRVIGIGLLTSLITVLVIVCVWMIEFVKSIKCAFLVACRHLVSFDYIEFVDAPSPYPGFRGCFVTHIDESPLWKSYVMLTVLEFSASRFISMCSFDLRPVSLPCAHCNQRLSVMFVSINFSCCSLSFIYFVIHRQRRQIRSTLACHAQRW
jgi:hypothetical protein